MYSDENKASSLAKLLIGFDTVMLDTCSLMEDSFPEWLDVLKEAKDYLDQGFTLVVPKACYTELLKHSISRDVEKKITAKRALKILKKAKHDRLVSVGKKNFNENFADNAIYSQASQDRISQRILVITQDKKLATDLKNLNKLTSQKGKPISVYKVVPGGKLEYNQGETFQKNNNWKENKPFADRKSFKTKDYGNKDVKENAPLSLEEKVVQGDKRLSANLKNPNYSMKEKISDIEKQLQLLSGISEEKIKSLHLLQGRNKLTESLAMLKGKKEIKPEAPKPTEKKEPVSNPEPAKKEIPSETKPEPTILVKMPPKKLWYGEGSTIASALNMVAEHYNLMFRDPSIPYFAMVHGAIDLTTNDFNEIIRKLSQGFLASTKVEFNYSSFKVIGEKEPKGYKAYIDLDPRTSVQPETEEKAKSAAPLSVEPAEKKEEKKTTKKPAKVEKKPAKPKENTTSEVKAVPNNSAAVPGGVTLVIGIPTDERKRGYIERSAKRDSMKNTSEHAAKPKKTKDASSSTKKKETASSPKKAEPAPSKKAKASADKKTKDKAAPKADSKAKAKAPAKKETAKPTAEKKPVSKPVEEKKPSPKKAEPKKKAAYSNLAVALKAEKILKANIHNPNYPSASKKKDLEAQVALVKKLSKEDQAKLTLNLDALKGMLYLL